MEEAPIYFASARSKRLRAEETLPGKLPLILHRLRLKERVKGESVAIKMHLGENLGYSTIHPLFVRLIVEEIRQGGGEPFVTDTASAVAKAHERGYTPQTLGCPIVPVAGKREEDFLAFEREFKGVKEWRLGKAMGEATFLVSLAHAKGHPTCGFGGSLKNLALGAMAGGTRSAIHDTMQFDRYWFKERAPDLSTRERVIQSCPWGALVQDKEDPQEVHLHFDLCNQCQRCLKVAPPGSLKIAPVNFSSFQEACAISAAFVLSSFPGGSATFIDIATLITPMCDCLGFTTLPVLPDLGIFASDDPVAVDKAVLDALAGQRLIRENVPEEMELNEEANHPFTALHGPLKDPYLMIRYGEGYGLGRQAYRLVEVSPELTPPPRPPISAGGP